MSIVFLVDVLEIYLSAAIEIRSSSVHSVIRMHPLFKKRLEYGRYTTENKSGGIVSTTCKLSWIRNLQHVASIVKPLNHENILSDTTVNQ